MIPNTAIQQKTLQLYPDFSRFLKELKPANLLALYDDIENIEESVAKQRLSLYDINHLYTDGKSNPAVEYLENWLIFLMDFLNINNRLTRTQEVAFMIYDDYKHFYLTDLKILFKKIMRAEYGTFYGSVDSQRLFYSFMRYNIERSQIVNKTTQAAKNRVSEEYEKISKKLKGEIWKKLTEQGLKDAKLWEEMDKEFNEQFPIALAQAESKFLLGADNISE